MTNEQQTKLLEVVQLVLEKHGEVAESIAEDNSEDKLLEGFKAFTTAFGELSTVYSDITGEETTEVQKQETSNFNNLFGVMNDFK